MVAFKFAEAVHVFERTVAHVILHRQPGTVEGVERSLRGEFVQKAPQEIGVGDGTVGRK